jgi:hypothetical protein
VQPAAGLGLIVSAIGALLPATLIAPMLRDDPASGLFWLLMLVTIFPYIVAGGLAWVCRADARSASAAETVTELVVLLGWAGGWRAAGLVLPSCSFSVTG